MARLLAATGQVVPVDRLIDDLYSDEVPPKALASVQSYVSNLRRALEPGRAPRTAAGVLVTAPPGYALRLAPSAVDAWRFESLIRDPDAAPEQLAEALRLWQGPAYQEFAGQHWADAEAARLEELRLSAVERHADALIRLGGAARAVPDLELVVGEHPLREAAWGLLARALYRCGRQGEALAALRRARAHLAEELGVDPGPSLRQLEADLLAQAPHLTETAPALPPPPAVVISQPYVGRRSELAGVLARESGVVLVSGEPGAGKTALIEQVRRRLAADGWAVGWGRCPEHEGAPAAWPWAELLRTLAPPDLEALAPLLSDAPVRGDVAGARFRLHRAVGSFLAGCAPALVVLDDLHRADAETLALLASVAEALRGRQVLLIGSYRHTELGDRLTDLLASLAVHDPLRISLDGLSRGEVGELVELTCGAGVAAAVVDEIADRTGGNPFFVRETARLLSAEGVVAVPAGVRDVLRRRVARLPAQAQTVLRHAAVIGRETSLDVLVAVSGLDFDAVLDAVEAGLVTGLLTEPAAGRVRFAHALIRDTLYDDLSRIRRARTHERVARAVEVHHPDDVAALAHHFTAAGVAGKATHYSRLAAEQAARRFAHDEAAALWQQALDASAEPLERLELTLGLVSALANTGQLVKARTHRAAAVRAAIPFGDPELLARVIVSFEVPTFWSNREYGGLDVDLIAAIESSLLALPPGDGRARCMLLTTLGFELEGEETSRGYEASLEAVAMARRLDDRDLLVHALNGRLHQSFRYGGQAERVSLGAELVALAGQDVTIEVLGHLVLMQSAVGAADFAAADAHALRVRELATRYGLRLPIAVVGFYEGMREGLTGSLESAESQLRAAATLAGELGMWQHEVGLLALARYGLRLMRGCLGPMLDELAELQRFERWHEQIAELLALALCREGRHEEARVHAASVLGPVRRDYFWHLLTSVRGLLGVELDDRSRVAAAYEALLPFAAQPVGSTGYLAIWPTARVLGDLAAYLGLPADLHYRQAAQIAHRANIPWWTHNLPTHTTP